VPVDWTSGLPASLCLCVEWLWKRRKRSIYPACQLDNDALDELAVALVHAPEPAFVAEAGMRQLIAIRLTPC
jgi:hypothetical protein